MNRREKERIISRANHKHEAEGLALHFEGDAAQPKRTATASGTTRREHAEQRFLPTSDRRRQAEGLRRQAFPPLADRRWRQQRGRAAPRSPRSSGEVRGRIAVDERSALSAQHVWASRACACTSWRALRWKIDHGRHHAGSRFNDAVSGVGCRFVRRDPEISEQQARADPRAIQKSPAARCPDACRRRQDKRHRASSKRLCGRRCSICSRLCARLNVAPW